MMSGEERRNRLVAALRKNSAALPARELAQKYDVSRQVVVQDVALLRANGYDIIATNRGYILRNEGSITRVFKVHHTREDCADEMNLIVDTGGRIEDVFIFHKHYGVVRADLKIRSRRDVNVFMEDIGTGTSSLLSDVTGGYHYHTVSADSREVLDDIQKLLEQKGFWAELLDHEPVDFWAEDSEEEETTKQ